MEQRDKDIALQVWEAFCTLSDAQEALNRVQSNVPAKVLVNVEHAFRLVNHAKEHIERVFDVLGREDALRAAALSPLACSLTMREPDEDQHGHPSPLALRARAESAEADWQKVSQAAIALLERYDGQGQTHFTDGAWHAPDCASGDGHAACDCPWGALRETVRAR